MSQSETNVHWLSNSSWLRPAQHGMQPTATRAMMDAAAADARRWADGIRRTRIRVRIAKMLITSGRVVSGKIVVDGEPLPDGAVVTVLAREVDETFELDAAAEAELLESIAEGDRGETVPADEVLRALRNLE